MNLELEYDTLTIGGDQIFLGAESDPKYLKPDKDGYYTKIVGAVNTFNSRGEYYVGDNIDNFFGKGSSFVAQVKDVGLESEVEHPEFKEGMTLSKYIERNLVIDKNNVCALIKDIWISRENWKEKNATNNLILIYAKLKPYGKRSDFLQNKLSNKINVAHSIRSITMDNRTSFPYKKRLKKIITFDTVERPGIQYADVNHTMKFSNESESSVTIDLKDDVTKGEVITSLNDLIKSHQPSGLGLESDDTNLSMVIDLLECKYGGTCIMHKW